MKPFSNFRSNNPLNYVHVWKHPIHLAVTSRAYFYLAEGVDCSNPFYDVKNWKACRANQRLFDTLASKINITISSEGSDKYGYIMYYYSGLNEYPAYTTTVILGPWIIVYCNYEPPPSKQSSLMLWLRPNSTGVWTAQLLLLVVVPLAAILLQNLGSDTSGSQLFERYATELLSQYGTLLRQGPASSSLTPLGLMAMTLYSIVVLSRYEYFHTSELVVPVTYKPFTSLKEFVEKGYKIKVTHGAWEDLMKTTFELQGIQNFYNESVIYPGMTVPQVIATFSEDDPKFGSIVGDAAYNIRYIKYQIHKGRYECYSFDWATEFYYYVWYLPVMEVAKRMNGAMEGGGFPGYWKKIDGWVSASVDRTDERKANMQEDEVYITFFKLKPFFILIYCLTGAWILVLCVEITVEYFKKRKSFVHNYL